MYTTHYHFLFTSKLRLLLPIGTTFHTQEGELGIAIESVNFSPVYVVI